MERSVHCEAKMYEIWKIEGRNRVLVAGFRIRDDADRYIGAFGDEAELELIVPATASTASTIPPRSVRRMSSGVVVASEHPDEFIADQATGDD